MSWLIPAVVANLSSSMLLAAVYIYLYLNEHRSCMLLWSIGWGVIAIRFLIQIVILTSRPSILLSFIFYTIIPISGFFIVWGTKRFLGQRLTRYWVAISLVIFVWTAYAVLTNRQFLVITLPVFMFLAIAYIFTGISLLQTDTLIGSSKNITAVLLILWGFHIADFPFLRQAEWFAPWGFLLRVIFEVAVAFGFLLIYFEKNQQELGQRLTRAHKYLPPLDENNEMSLEAKLQQRLSMERLVSSLSNRLITNVNDGIDLQIEDGLKSVAEFIGCDEAYLIFFDSSFCQIERMYKWRQPNLEQQVESYLHARVDRLVWDVEKIKSGEVIEISDIQHLPNSSGDQVVFGKLHGMRSLLVIPIRQGGLVRCVLSLGHHAADKRWLAADVELLGLSGKILAQSIDHLAAQQKIRQSEREKALVLNAVEESIVHVDKYMHIQSYNRTALTSSGKDTEDLIGHYCFEIFHGRQETCEKCPVEKSIQSGLPEMAEMTSADGRTWFTKGYPVRNELGDIIGGVDFTLETTHRKQTEQKLQLKITQQTQLIDASRQLTESLDVKTVLTRIVSGARQIVDAYGCTLYLLEKEANVLRPVVVIDPPYEDEILATPLNVNRSLTGQAVIHRKGIIFNDPIAQSLGQHIPETPEDDNERLIVAPLMVDEQVHGAMCLNRLGQSFSSDDLRLVEAFAAFASTIMKNAQVYERLQIEINERRLAEQALSESEKHLRMIMEQAPVGIVTIDMDGVITDINQKGLDILGSPARETTVGLNVFHLETIHEAGLDRHFRDVLTTGDGRETEIWYTSVRGKRAYLRSTLVSRVNGSGEKVGALQLLEDVTSRKLSDEQLHLQAKTMEAAANGILIADRDGNIVWANPAIERLTGYKPVEVIGLNLSIFNSGKQDEVFFRELWETILSGQAWQGEIINRRKDGSLYYEDMTITPVYDDTDHISHFINIKQDITTEKENKIIQGAVLQMAEALRGLETSGEMAPIIAQQIMHIVGASGSSLVFNGLSERRQEAAACAGNWCYKSDVLEPIAQEFSDEILKQQKPVFLNGPRSETNGPGQLEFVAGIPLIAQDETVGIIWVLRESEFLENDKVILASLSDMIANALQRVTLHEATQRKVQQLAALHNIDLAINASVDINLTLNLLLNQVQVHLQVDAADILRLDQHTQTLHFQAGRGFNSKAIEKAWIPLGVSAESEVALERKRILIPDISKTSYRFERNFQKMGEDFIFYCAEPLIAKGRLIAILEVFQRKAFEPDTEWLDFLETLAGQAAIAIDNASLFNDLQRTNQDLAVAYNTTLEGWARALELRDEATEGHTRRVTDLTVRLARQMGISGTELVNIQRGAMLHDIGKMAIPDRILTKPGPLTEEEWETMRMHPVYARDMLATIPYLENAIDIPLYHHEHWDGTGYPLGLLGEEIPLAARIFAVVDIWDALRNVRVYRDAWPDDQVLNYIQEHSGSHLDPNVVKVFMHIEKDLDSNSSSSNC